MQRPRGPTTGYERLTQAERFSDESDDEGNEALGASFASLQAGEGPRYGAQAMMGEAMASSLPSTGMGMGLLPVASSSSRRRRANSGVDLKAINARLERWADEIAAKFKRSKRRSGADEDEDERLEIHYSVFQAPEGVRPVTAESLAASAADGDHMSKAQFEAIVDSVRTAISQGMHPRMIAQGSSGSYFARNLDGKVVGVFKPKDEEPYAAGNPKWNKWIHRNLFPCCFGRACLIPNLSYVSEAAAYVLDAQLRTHMVPYTDVVYLASRSFHYPFWDRYAHSRGGKALPPKPGSFQVFLTGFKDANIFLREHPWPDQYLSGFRTGRRHGGPGSGRRPRWADNCRPASRASRSRNGTPSGRDAGANGSTSNGDSGYDDGYSDYDEGAPPSPEQMLSPDNFVWTEPLKAAFREELEKLVILDYIMRNTDRGLDNWMIKVDWSTQAVSIASEPMHLHMETGGGGNGATASDDDNDNDDNGSNHRSRPVDLSQRAARDTRSRAPYPSYRAQQPMQAASPADSTGLPKITVGAIDNSLSWPWKHPDAWRSFPFGWLFLPVDLIGRPFSQKTREHFLPLLTSTAWWSQTQLALRRIFMMDPDFQERMFARQMAVMKGQAWNVVETLKTTDHGPLELTRRAKVCVWDDLVEVPIAVPMRATSSEMRRRAESEIARAMEEEMDIGSAGGGGSSSGDVTKGTHRGVGGGGGSDDDLLLGNTSPLPQATPAARLPRPGRFELTKETEEEGEGNSAATGSTATASRQNGSARAAALNLYAPGRHERRYSYATAGTALHVGGPLPNPFGQTHGRASSVDGYVYDEDVEGDLGYAAAEGMENNRRRVIVERLEPVKSKNPVFTWC
ncbi:phosphatidylinositol 4-kinase type 2 subunit [Grosmannia clavigera kw1407]|uniref:Phosphatidylinositol 4-kinase n=1 Tax=Grosmannia clavigera (strain kw1407 / UAMH 11150) TaxID=655863 RepID=F0XLG0_GROCL|nr:phosphatidylinositol 4-kinase type 2 subunit [Grosmannia clavigera kw1407]EFX01527.1 phosphatidylinositol 4-kinase type 2 subunit [Grosmannia clavigera kw1407]